MGLTKVTKTLGFTSHPFGAVYSQFCASFALAMVVTLFGHECATDFFRTVLNSPCVYYLPKSVSGGKQAINLVGGIFSTQRRKV